MQIRKSKIEDLARLMELFAEARATIGALGIDQWQDGYPNEQVVMEDIMLGRSYCMEQDGQLWGTFVLVPEEPCYDCITQGRWRSNEEDYIAIHRVAVAVAKRGQGLPGMMMSYAADCAVVLGRCALRIDTHRGNVVMRRMLEKQGFQHCGTIYLQNGDPRVAYERLLTESCALGENGF